MTTLVGFCFSVFVLGAVQYHLPPNFTDSAHEVDGFDLHYIWGFPDIGIPKMDGS